jgi:PLD-like domain
MPILGTDAFRGALQQALRQAERSVSLVSAYATAAGIKWVLSRMQAQNLHTRVLVRWACKDLVSGASELEVYELLKARGIKLFLQPDLHAKAILVDDRVLLLGSANLTAAGLQLVPGGNRELGIQVVPSSGDINSIDGLFADACEVTPALYETIKAEVIRLRQNSPPAPEFDWPPQLGQHLFPRAPSRLWVSEFLWTSNPSEFNSAWVDKNTAFHDANLLGVPALDANIGELRLAFQRSRSYVFLHGYFERNHKNQLYFGELTSAIQESLLDDPRPYRRDVKELTASLLGWLAHLGGPSFVIDRPNYSQRLRSVAENDYPDLEADFVRQLELLHVDASADWDESTTDRAPHKPLLLLEIITQIATGQIDSNIVRPTNELQSGFDQMWRSIFGESRNSTMALPFYHLRTESFWYLHSSLVPEVPESARQSVNQLRELDAFAWIDDTLFFLLQRPSFRKTATDALINAYFRRDAAESLRRRLR